MNAPNSPYQVSAEWGYAVGEASATTLVIDAMRLENACLSSIVTAQQKVITELSEKLRALTAPPVQRTPADDVASAIAPRRGL